MEKNVPFYAKKKKNGIKISLHLKAKWKRHFEGKKRVRERKPRNRHLILHRKVFIVFHQYYFELPI